MDNNVVKEYAKKMDKLDADIEKASELLSRLKQERQKYSNALIAHGLNNQLKSFSIDNIPFKITQKSVPQALSYKYLQNTLKDIIPNEGQIDQIIEYLKQNREVKTVTEIKRLQP